MPDARRRSACMFATALLAAMGGSATLPAQADGAVTNPPASAAPLPRPDGRPADLTEKVQVFILLGQSNMLGFGKVDPADKPGSLRHAVTKEGLYPFLVDEDGNWTERRDARNVRVMVGRGGKGMRVFNNEWLTIKGRRIGPEVGIGHHLGNHLDAPVLILKSCIGNRSLGWDLLPPGSERFEREGQVYAGYKDSPDRWAKGTEPKAINWYAGKQYDDDIANAKKVLADLAKYYPGAKGYEIAGFFWWQGAKDCGNVAHAERYEQNLVRLIGRLRQDFDAPHAKFVCATLGQTERGADGNEGLILDAQLAVDGRRGKYGQFAGNVATIYSNPLCHGGAANSHYGGNAKTYMDIGLAMGAAMVALLDESR
ncbi:MAG: sialate O-acetylesterase [bacterium]|nr:sialate O-acetylesterase [bacterium]